MVRSALGKVAWVGRTASMVFGLALVLALIFGVTSMAFGANGQNFILGKAKNAATKVTGLVGNVDGGASLRVTNPNSGTNDTALDLRVQAGEAPMRVNSTARVANLNAATAGRADSAASADTATNAGNADTVDSKHAADFAAAAHAHDERYYTETESDGRYLGKTQKAADSDKLDGQDSSAFAPTSHNHDGRYYSSGSKVADSDKLDGKDSSAFGIRTEHNWAYAYDCDTPDTYNECAPVTVTVPDGRTYYASVWSTFSAKHSEGFGAFQEVWYCSAGKGSGISTSNPCITPFGKGNMIELDERLSSASSSGESIPLSAGTYTFFTAINPDKALGIDYRGLVITKVMIRDAANGL